jgi:hypothetical protein
MILDIVVSVDVYELLLIACRDNVELYRFTKTALR